VKTTTAIYAFIFFTLFFHSTVLFAQTQRALIIGNAAYSIGNLDNPINDANDIASKLEQLDFEVTLLVDTDYSTMRKAISQFYANISDRNDVSVFYYAGHAMQIDSVNYLLPLDVKYDSVEAIINSTLDLNFLLNNMKRAKSRSNIVILDACRNNPFEKRSSKSQQSSSQKRIGLAPVEAPPGTFIAYSTEPGRVASDGMGRNGTYTKYLLKHLKTAVGVETMFKKVRQDVMRVTNQKQIPWEHSSLYENFLFKKNDAEALPNIPSF